MDVGTAGNPAVVTSPAYFEPDASGPTESVPVPLPVADESATRTMWPNFDIHKVLTDTSLIAWWNRAYIEETAAGVPPERRLWTPSAVTGQLVWLTRSMPDSSVLLTGGVFNGITTVHSPVVTTQDLVMPVEAGVRLSVPLGRPGNWQPELSYLGVFDQNASVCYAPDASLGVTESIAPFFDQSIANAVTNMTVSYESDLHSVECNLWYDDGWRFQALAGFRWIQFEEELEQFESQNWSNGNFAELVNNLYGGQVGFRMFLFERGKLSMFAIGKGGVFYNDASLLADSQSGGVTVNSLSQSGNTTAWLGELNVTAVWQFTPYFSFHAGYTGLWLSQVGLVGDQLDNFTFAAGGGTFEYGNVDYQGGHLGVTFAW